MPLEGGQVPPQQSPVSRRARAALLAALGLAVLATVPVASSAAPVPARPIPEGQTDAPRFLGAPALSRPLTEPAPPRHPFMAPNARSNLHNDAYASDVYFRQSGPLGRSIARRSTFLVSDCASLGFDTRDRIVSICVGLDRPRLVLFNPQTLAMLASFDLPPRDPSSGNPFSGFSGGGYFYLDGQDRTITPTPNRQVWVIAQRGTPAGPSFALQRVYDLSTVVPPGDAIVSALPDYDGRIWFVSSKGIVGTIARGTGAVRSRRLPGEEIGNSFSVDETGGVYIVSDAAMYRFDATASGYPATTWREVYDNDGVEKPSQVTAGSGTTPTLMGRDLVAIADNDDPIKAVFYRRAKSVSGDRLVCDEPLFARGRSATENSLIGTRSSIVAENNFGYTGPAVTERGGTTAPGLTRVDVDRRTGRCDTVWESSERAPSVVPKLSLANGLVYTYTKPPRPQGDDPWYLTALDFRSGRTVFKRLAGEGLGYNNNYAPMSLGPDGSAYVGTLGGLVRLADTGRAPGGGGGGPPGGSGTGEGGPPGDCGGRDPTIAGTSGDDELRGTSGPDVIAAGAGDDTVQALGGEDSVCGESGLDRLDGGPGDDLLHGGSGRDTLDGGDGRDSCVDGSGGARRERCER